MTATTCTLTRLGEVDDLHGPWRALLGDFAALEDLLRAGIDGLVPNTSAEEFRRAMVIALSDGSAGTEHAVDLPGRGRRWFAWSLAKRPDGRLDGVVVDVTRSRAGSAWNVACEVTPRLVAAAPDLRRAGRVLAASLGRELEGVGSILHAGPHLDPGLVRAQHAGRSSVRWDPNDAGGRCEVVVPLHWPSGGTSVLTIRTPYRLDLWLDDIHLTSLARSVEAALVAVDRTSREVEAVARERQFTETLALELHQPMRLLRRTLDEANTVTDDAQRQYLLQRAMELGGRLSRVTELVATAALDAPPTAPSLLVLRDALARATAIAGNVEVRGEVDDDLAVLADESLLTRALVLALQVLATPGPVEVAGSRSQDTVRLHLHARRSVAEAGGVGAGLGNRLVEQLVTACGGTVEHCRTNGPTVSCDMDDAPPGSVGVTVHLPQPVGPTAPRP